MPEGILLSFIAIDHWEDKKKIILMLSNPTSNISHIGFRITFLIQTNIFDLRHLGFQR